MANSSILAAFERMWQHVVAALANKADVNHSHSYNDLSDIPTNDGSGTITGVSVNGTSIATSGVANIPAASTSAYGVTKLSSSTSDTSTTTAATPSAVKAAYDLANGKADATHNQAASTITSGTLSSDRLPTIPVEKGGTGQTSIVDTTYTTVRYRGSALVSSETNPTQNGTINWTYE